MITEVTKLIERATRLGWTPAECHNLVDSCQHLHTDGVGRCWECGTTSLSFQASAQDWIDKHTKNYDNHN